MSQSLLNLAKKFVSGGIAPDAFVEAFADGWRGERDSGLLVQDDDVLSEKLSTIFCFADLYNAEEDREEYEYDASKLRCEVEKILR